METSRNWNWVPYALLIFFIIINATLSFVNIGEESMWGDEQNAVRIAKLSIPEILKGPDATHPPGYHLMLHWWLGIVGDSDTGARSLAAFFAIASVPAIFFLARKLFGITEAVIAAGLLSVSQFFISYAQEARPYTIVVFFTIISTYLLFKVLKEKTASGWYALTAIIGLYTHYFFIFIFIFHLLSASFAIVRMHKDRLILFAKSFGPVFLIYGIWAVYKFIPRFILNDPNKNLIAWIRVPNLESVTSFLKVLSGLTQISGILLWGAIIVIAILFFLPIIAEMKRKRFELNDHGSEFLVAGACMLTVLAVFSISQLHPIWVPRYLIIVLPFFILFFAHSLANIRLQAVIVILVCLFALSNSIALAHMYSTQEKEDWRSATLYLESNYRSGDSLVFYALPKFLANHYSSIPFVKAFTGTVSGDEERALAIGSLREAAKTNQRLFLIHSYQNEPNAILAELLKEADSRFVFVNRNLSKGVVIDLFERPLIVGGSRVDTTGIIAIEPEDFRGRLGETFEGVLPFYGRGDTARFELDVPSGNYVITLNARGDPPGPVPLEYQTSGKRGRITIDGNVTKWRELSIPIVVEYGLFELEFSFINDTYKTERGQVVADNAAYIRNIRLIRVPGGR